MPLRVPALRVGEIAHREGLGCDAVPSLLLYGDTRQAPLRHEVPLEIVDPFLFADHDGRPHVLTNALERGRIEEALPEAEIVLADRLGVFDLIDDGMSREDALLEVAVRAVKEWRIEE